MRLFISYLIQPHKNLKLKKSISKELISLYNRRVMLKGTEMPDNYNDLPLYQKEVLWLGTLLAYERSEHFPSQYWHDKIVEISFNIIFEDENIVLAKCYNGEYCLEYKNGAFGITGGFESFFIDNYYDEIDDDEVSKSLFVGRILGIDTGEEITLIKYLRMKGFPITSEFWTERE